MFLLSVLARLAERILNPGFVSLADDYKDGRLAHSNHCSFHFKHMHLEDYQHHQGPASLNELVVWNRKTPLRSCCENFHVNPLFPEK